MSSQKQSERQYIQKFRDAWYKNSEFSEWLKEEAGKAYCKFCKTYMKPKLYDIKSHAKTKKHRLSTDPFTKTRHVNEYFSPEENVKLKIQRQKAEAGLALFILNHSSVRTIDHLTDLCKSIFSSSEHSAYIQLHRTKCSAIIKNVFYPFFKESLRNDIGDSKYSLLIDESTDISVSKYLGISIRYFSENTKTVITTYLSLEPLENGTADGILDALQNCLKNYNLDIQNMIGLGTDNANVMIGTNNGVHKKLKQYNPSLILVRCVCHSIQLAVSATSKHFLPENLEFLLSETYNWFSKSSSRQSQYNMLYSAINCGERALKIVQKSATRWLSIESCVSRITHQWLELSKHFELARTNERCFVADLLFKEYNNEINLVYLLFLKSYLKDISELNKKFESNGANPIKLLNDLCFLIESLIATIVYPDAQIDKLEADLTPFIYKKAYLGREFEDKIWELRNEKIISVDQEEEIRGKCINFIKALVTELKNRLPENFKILRMISKFSVENMLFHQNEAAITEVIKLFYVDVEMIDKVMKQIKNLKLFEWNEKNDSLKFWVEVKNYKDASNIQTFSELADMAINMLCLPWSNAEVERIFSQLNVLKTKIRNRLNSETINKILTSKYGLKRMSKCCSSFDFPVEVLRKIGKNEIYGNTNYEERQEESDFLSILNCTREIENNDFLCE